MPMFMSILTSKTLWMALGVAATLSMGLLAWRHNRHTNLPKRQIAYRKAREVDHLEIDGWKGRLVDIEVTNSGSRDITSSHFHDDKAIELRLLGGSILRLKGAVTDRGRRVPSAAIERGALVIKPSLIAKGQTVTYSALIDGPGGPLECDTSLIDAKPPRKLPDGDVEPLPHELTGAKSREIDRQYRQRFPVWATLVTIAVEFASMLQK
ncbi:hypothetical protein AB0C11_10710 [Streptomyces sp. NPDC039016]|uniref:hypothetical protein n=1 Tax=Streptomyces sp. NPDC039016 TaxID=3154330 RepID=UPI0033FB7B3D